MNAVVPFKEEISPPRYGLVPANIPEAMKLAEMMATARLVPAALQKSPADCLMVIQQAVRWDMDPFAVAQECSVISGKLMHSGKLVAAVVNARGNLTQRLSFEYSGSGDDRTIIVSGQLQGEPQPRIVEVTLKNAKTTNTMWQKQPDQQLMYHGCRVWARRHTPELMLGVYSPEEWPEESQTRRPQQPAPNVMLPSHNADTGEVFDDPASPSAGQHEPAFATAEEPAPSQSAPQPGGAGSQSWEEYVLRWDTILEDADDARALSMLWNSAAQKKTRAAIDWPFESLQSLITRVGNRIAELKGTIP